MRPKIHRTQRLALVWVWPVGFMLVPYPKLRQGTYNTVRTLPPSWQVHGLQQSTPSHFNTLASTCKNSIELLFPIDQVPAHLHHRATAPVCSDRYVTLAAARPNMWRQSVIPCSHREVLDDSCWESGPNFGGSTL
ncbi:hypothetical protein N658DRAFT_71896 [Parathielavia hyrcaniae]|uniref:Uncharacterized protein n=1 Tax=Parathielavia hyrcaniae TaxID=113614 RepID=A0AAN6Q5F4_9PEZI|nr:hypothetical protein N658DRAFT_71896 [Parathielavia hyrcaniae]